ncbi:MAG TPA: serine/threonine protein phosphatase, partial [Methylocella sp.]
MLALSFRSIVKHSSLTLRYYVHAGISPGVPLDQQTAYTKLWIRDSFLRHRGPFPKYIVHGHTP